MISYTIIVMEYLKTVDYIIIVLLFIGGIWGAIKGLIDELSTKFGYVVGFIVAFMFTSPIGKLFTEQFGFPYWFSAFIGYFLIFMIGYCFVRGFGSVLNNICEESSLDVVDHLLGFFLGGIEALLLIGLAEYLLNYQNLFNLQEVFDESFLSSRLIMPLSTWFVELFNSVGGIV